jgi:hypothetical protein
MTEPDVMLARFALEYTVRALPAALIGFGQRSTKRDVRGGFGLPRSVPPVRGDGSP